MTTPSFIPSLWKTNGDNFNPFDSLQREVDRVFGEFNRGLPFPELRSESGALWMTPKIDISEEDTFLAVTAELPGVEEKDIDVTVEKGSLTIKAEKKVEKDEETKNYHVVERSYGMFQRSIPLPFEADADKVEAKFENGVLTVSMPKPPELEGKRRKIQIGQKN